MLNSLYSGISGLRSNQTYLDVIANNVSNVNTTAFKASRVTFSDAMSMTVGRAITADDDTNLGLGGRNNMQIGRGTLVASVDVIHTLGTFSTTNRSLDVAIEKEGYYFMIQDTDSSIVYTRAGNFYLDNEGNLVTQTGRKVLDKDKEEIRIDDNPQEYTDHAINSRGELVAVNSEGDLEVIGTLGLARFANEGGLLKIGSNMYSATDAAGETSYGSSGDVGFETQFAESTLELSNVDLSQEFSNMIIAQRAYQSNARTISKSDAILEELVNLVR